MDLVVGEVLDARYRLESLLGQGGMGTVWRATDLELGRTVAIKTIRGLRDEHATSRFRREARILAAIDHPNIVPIYDFLVAQTTQGRLPCIVMPVVLGVTLEDYLAEQGRIDVAIAAGLIDELLELLEVAHEAGVIHRDIKPANMMLEQRAHGRRLRLMDFGIARVAHPDMAATAAQAFLGTPAYMSPEQLRNAAEVDARADLWAAAVCLYELVTGAHPYEASSPLELVARMLAERPRRASDLDPSLPEAVDRFFESAFAEDITARPASAADMRARLAALGPLRAAIEVGVTADLADPRALEPTVAAPSSPSEPAVIVGRGAELTALVERMRLAASGTGSAIFVTGAAGLGKSTLVDAFCRQVAARVMRGRCLERHGSMQEPFFPFLEALSHAAAGKSDAEIVACLRERAPTWLLQLPGLVSSTIHERIAEDTVGATRERMLRELGDAITTMASSEPVVLLLEDLHWADASSIDALRYLSERLERARVLIVATLRPEEAENANPPLRALRLDLVARGAWHALELQTLLATDTKRYLEGRFGAGALPESLLDRFCEVTGGHPLFVAGLAQTLIDRGDLARVAGAWRPTRPPVEIDLGIPDSVRGMIERKLDALDDDDRRALQFASAIGDHFSAALLSELMGVDDLVLEERLDRLARIHRWLVVGPEEELPDGSLTASYAFAHVLYRNVLYEALLPRRRTVLEREVGLALMRRHRGKTARIAAIIAGHFERGREIELAVQAFIEAGDHAFALYGNEEAAKWFDRALELSARLTAEEGRSLAAAALEKRAQVRLSQARYLEAAEDFLRLRDLAAQTSNATTTAAAYAGLANAYMLAHREDEMQAAIAEVAEVAEQADDDELRAASLKLRCYHALIYRGDLVAAAEMANEMRAVGRRLEAPQVVLDGLGMAWTTDMFCSNYRAAISAIEEAETHPRHRQDAVVRVEIPFCHAIMLGNLGRLGEALAVARGGYDFARRNGDHMTLSRFPNLLGWLYRELGDEARARELDSESLELALANEASEAESHARLNLALADLACGRTTAAAEHLDRVARITDNDSWMRWRTQLRLGSARVRMWLDGGDVELAESCARELLERAQHHGAGKYVADAWYALALVAAARDSLDDAARLGDQALEQLRATPAPILEWKVLAELSHIHERRGHAEARAVALSGAAVVIREIAGRLTDEPLRRCFLGAPAVARVLAQSEG